GYHRVPPNGGDEVEFRICLEEARVVRQIFEWVGRDRVSLFGVCQRLKDQGIPSPTGKPTWNRPYIWWMLKNPAYKGTAAFGKRRSGPRRAQLRPQRGSPEQPRLPWSIYSVPPENWILMPVPAIVSEALFASVQEQLEENRKLARQRWDGATNLLQGL